MNQTEFYLKLNDFLQRNGNEYEDLIKGKLYD